MRFPSTTRRRLSRPSSTVQTKPRPRARGFNGDLGRLQSARERIGRDEDLRLLAEKKVRRAVVAYDVDASLLINAIALDPDAVNMALEIVLELRNQAGPAMRPC